MEPSLSNPDEWVDLYGDALYAYALKMIPDPHQVENLLQETFLAALKAKESFKGKAGEKTWLMGILRHKILDYLRSKYREVPVSSLSFNEANTDHFFHKDNEKVIDLPALWDIQPDKILEKGQFWEVFEKCLKELPQRAAEAFGLREIERIKSNEICKVLNITATNLWTLLHRARLQLRRCLEINWFKDE